MNEGLSTVHDLSDGGLAAAASDIALASKMGLTLSNPTDVADHAFWFGEDQARFLVGLAPDKVAAFLSAAKAAGLVVAALGTAGGDQIVLQGQKAERVRIAVADLGRAHEAWLPDYMARPV